jgi:hypothetical protein
MLGRSKMGNRVVRESTSLLSVYVLEFSEAHVLLARDFRVCLVWRIFMSLRAKKIMYKASTLDYLFPLEGPVSVPLSKYAGTQKVDGISISSLLKSIRC